MIRPATPADVPEILAMIRELAAYERAAHEVVATEQAIAAALFAPHPAVFAHVADEGGEAVGFALWFRNFSTWLGRHGIFLEDLYVRPHARRRGHGRALLAELGRVALEHGYGRLEWWVLHWNATARDFYERLGASSLDEWLPYRVTDDALRRLGVAAGDPA